MIVRRYSETDKEQLISLWQIALPDNSPHNEPSSVIDAKLRVDQLLFVGEESGRIVGSVMAGYDGHRGWLYSVAVSPDSRRTGRGSSLVRHAISALQSRGCIKVNLQVRSTNAEVAAFYQSLGFVAEDRLSMGLLLQANGSAKSSGTGSIQIRPFVMADYEPAVQLWSSIEGLGLNESDTPQAISAFIERNPGFSAVAVGPKGCIIGTVLCGHNGRAGFSRSSTASR